MWSFVLLVVIGGYWAVRVLSDIIGDKAREAEINQRIDGEVNEWVSFMDDFSPTEQQKHDAFISARCKDEKAQEISRRIEEEAGIKPSEDMVIRGLLAQELRIPRKTLCNGIASDYGRRDREAILRKFLCWYDNELKSNGMAYDLLFIPMDKGNEYCKGNSKAGIPVSQNPDLVRGCYVWHPIRFVSRSSTGGDRVIF